MYQARKSVLQQEAEIEFDFFVAGLQSLRLRCLRPDAPLDNVGRKSEPCRCLELCV